MPNSSQQKEAFDGVSKVRIRERRLRRQGAEERRPY